MKIVIIVFPGSNCDRDVQVCVREVMGVEPVMVWHDEPHLPQHTDLVILPGGFSYGDYLRSGAMAASCQVMHSVKKYAQKGGAIVGICNGFQVLVESGLLPGALMRNRGLNFICSPVHLLVRSCDHMFGHHYEKASCVVMPIAHKDGQYFIDQDGLKSLYDHDQIAFQYVSPSGEMNPQSNVNGSVDHIAGLVSKNRRILGMMPHPERFYAPELGGTDGRLFFTSIVDALS